MYRFFQKHGKKLLAVFSAMLMIAFALPAYRGSGDSRNPVVGKIDGTKLYAFDLYNARQSWEMLKQVRVNQQGNSIADALGPDAVVQIDRQPVLFLLLQKEARRMGVSVSKDQLESIVANLPGLLTDDEDRNLRMRQAVAEFLLVRQAFQRASSAIKISDPMINHELARFGQSIMTNLVEFNAAKYTDKVPPPTPEQLQSQFEKYADVLKGTVNEANPFGFGYKYPDRVKLQYIAIPRSDVRKLIDASRTAYQWEVDSRKYYHLNQADYPTTQKAPSVDQSFSLDSTSSTTQPTTKPFDQVRQDIKDRIINDEVARKVSEIQERIRTILASDWVAYRDAAGASATQPTTTPATVPLTAPATALGVPYNSFDYLQKLADLVQSQSDVRPTVVNVADKWLTSDDLARLPGIGQATVELDQGQAPMPVYVMACTAAFVPAEFRSEPRVIQILEPTRAMKDPIDTIYIARVSAAEPAHRPASLAEVEPAVRADLITQQAYSLAKADATKLLDQARLSSLKDATGGKDLVIAGPITSRPNQTIPGFPITGPSVNEFVRKAFGLLSSPTTRPNARPIELIELPQDGRAIVAELGNVEAMWNDRSRPMEEAQLRRLMNSQLATQFGRQWFNFDSASARLGYVPDVLVKEQEPSAPPPPPVPPIF